MARLTGDAARQWLAQNPGASFIDNRTGQRVERQKSGIENLILGLSKPFRSGVGVAQEFGHTMGDLMNMAGGNYGAIGERPEKYALMSEEESRQLYEDPLQHGLKAGAGVMSYGLGGPPKGGYQAASALGRMGQAAGKGALASGVGAFGYSKEGEELESTLKGGLTGGIIGGALQGVSEIPGALRARGAKMQEKSAQKLSQLQADDAALLRDKQRLIDEIDDQIVTTQKMYSGKKSSALLREIDDQISSGVIGQVDDILPITDGTRKSLNLSPNQYEQLKTNILGDMSSKGFSIGSADDIANSWTDYLNMKFAEKNNILSQVGSQTVDASKTSQALKKISKIVGGDTTLTRALNDGIEEILGKGVTIDKIPKTLTTAQVASIKELADSLGGGAGKLLTADTSSQISQQLLNNVRDTSRDIVTQIEPLDDILNQLSDTYKLKPVVNEAPIVADRLAQKVSLQGQKQLGTLGQRKAREITRLGERSDSLAQRAMNRVQSLEQKKIRAASDLANATRDLSEKYQFQVKAPWPLTAMTQTPIPVGGDVRAPLAGIKQGLGSTMVNVPSGVDTALGRVSSIGQRAIPALQGLGQGRDVGQEDFTMGGSLSPEEAQILQQSSSQPQYTYQDAIMEAYQMFPGAPESTILSTAKFLLDQKGGGEEDLDMGTISNVEKAIDMIDQYGGRVAGKIAKGTGKIGEFFGAGSVGTEYRSLISDIRTNLIRYIAGTAQTPTEMKNLVDRLPQPTDEPAVAKIKLQVLLDSLYGGSQSGSNNTPNVSGSIADDYELDWVE
jgi:hypothetical protein